MEVAKSVDDLMTSRSIEGHAFPNFETLAAKIASALKRIITNQYFRLMWKSSMLKNKTDFFEEDRLLT